MGKSSENTSRRSREGLFTAFSAGAFLILLGTIFVATPRLYDDVSAFFMDFGVGVFLPAPKNPANHAIVYSVATQFSLAWGIFLIGLLFVRLFVRSPLQKKAENVADIVFWVAGSFLIGSLLNEATTYVLWFAFWAAVIMLIGVSLVIRAIILAVVR